MRRLVPVGLAALLCLGLTACGGSDSSSSTPSKEAPTSAPAVSTSAATEPATSAAEQTSSTSSQTTAPDPCTKLTAEEASSITGKKYTTSGTSTGKAGMCTYKGADPLSPILNLSAHVVGPGVTLEALTKALAETAKATPADITVAGADEAKQVDLAGLTAVVVRKDGIIYQLQYGDPANTASNAATAQKLAAAIVN